MINRMLQNKQPIIYGDGEQKRCFSFIQDCVYCIEKAIIQDNLNGEIINIGPDEEFVTINHLAEEIAKNLEFELKPIYTKERPNEVKAAVCSSDKARKLIGYKTKISFEDGIKEMIADIKERKPKKFKYTHPLEINNEKTPETWRKQMM